MESTLYGDLRKDLEEEEGKKQATRLAAKKKEIDNLTLPKAITALSPQEKTALKEKAQLEGEDYLELPAKVVFTIKPEKYKVRTVACGNRTKDTYGKITTTDLDTCMLRFILSWAASSRFNTIASLDVSAAFLNADLPPGRVVVLRPPTELHKHRSILLLVRQQDVLSTPQLTDAGLSQRVQPQDVLALCGIYVDDCLSVGPHDIVTSFLEHLRGIWKTTDPVYLTPGDESSFLGITLELTSVGLLLHQRTYTEDVLEEYKDVTPKRKRATTGKPEHFDKDAKWVRRARKILGALLWLLTRTRPDIACAVSLAAQSLWHNLDHLKTRLEHLLQYQHHKHLWSTPHLPTEGATINSF